MLKKSLYGPQELSLTFALFTLKRSSCYFDDLQTASVLSIHPLPYFIHPVFLWSAQWIVTNAVEKISKSTFNHVTIRSKIFATWPYIQDPLQTAFLTYFSSVQFSHLVVSDSLWPHESQHARPPCPSPTPGVHSDSRPSSQWCHPAISSSVVPFSCPQSLPASESFSNDLGTTAALSWSHQGGSQMGPKNLSHRFNAENQLILSIWKKNLAYNFKKF